MWKVGTILEKFKTHAPAIFKTAQNEETYAQAPKISIDYAIMEKSHLPPYMLCRRILAGMILAIEVRCMKNSPKKKMKI